jgi:hypothetical protein
VVAILLWLLLGVADLAVAIWLMLLLSVGSGGLLVVVMSAGYLVGMTTTTTTATTIAWVSVSIVCFCLFLFLLYDLTHLYLFHYRFTINLFAQFGVVSWSCTNETIRHLGWCYCNPKTSPHHLGSSWLA